MSVCLYVCMDVSVLLSDLSSVVGRTPNVNTERRKSARARRRDNIHTGNELLLLLLLHTQRRLLLQIVTL
jgi:hypothetical protein